MLLKLFTAGPRLSAGVIRLATCFATLIYVTLSWKASTFLPEFVFRDSEKIQSQIGGANTYQDTSFDAVAKFYAALGNVGTSLFVVAVGVTFICFMIGYSRRIGGMVISSLLIAPCVFFNLFVASKDTLVVLMSIVLVTIGRKWGYPRVAFSAFALYIGYAMTVRLYFVLILIIAVGTWLFRNISTRFKMLLMVSAVVLIFLMPNGVYYLLLHPRDMAVDYLVAGSAYGARTGFYNLLLPDTFIAFCVDYLYAVVKLNIPILFYPGPRELLMSIFVWIVIGSTFNRAQNQRGVAKNCAPDMLASLVVGHIAVSMLFEPDLGSYLRHLSSVALFCAWRLNYLTLPPNTSVSRPAVIARHESKI